ncbi:MAG: amidase, partial [Actinomycetota bacterium]|nr:amidase [Actinomycetota bacterium]
MDFLTDSVEAISERVRSGEQSAREVTEHAIARIEALNPTINAFVAWDGERALAQADALDARVAAGDDAGPLAGIPIGVKDLEAVEGYVTTFGSALHAADPAATADSVHVARLRAAGAIVMGKTNTPEYGHKGATDNVPFGQTVNPWSVEHSPGGSSGGTGAAIASGMV